MKKTGNKKWRKQRKKTTIGLDGREYVMVLKKPFYKKAWFWLTILIILAGVDLTFHVRGFLDAGNQTTSPGVVEEAKAGVNPTEPVAVTVEEKDLKYSIGEVITTDNFAISIVSRETSDKVESDSGYTSKTADGTYLILNIDYKNIANEAKRIDNSSFTLIVDGAEYSPTNDFIIIRDDSIITDTINPGIAKSGKIFFDVPKDIANRKELLLVLSDSFMSETGEAQINLK